MDKKLLEILVCPSTKQALSLLKTAELAVLNAHIDAGTLRNAREELIKTTCKEALLTKDRRTIYPVDDGIPVLLTDEAIAVSQLADFPKA